MHENLIRITIDLPQDEHKFLKKMAIDKNITLKKLIIDAIAVYLLTEEVNNKT